MPGRTPIRRPEAMCHMRRKLLNTNSFMFILSPGIGPAPLPMSWIGWSAGSMGKRLWRGCRRSAGPINQYERKATMKKVLATVMSLAFLVSFYPAVSTADTAACPEVEAAKTMLKQQASTSDVKAPRSLAGARSQDIQAPRRQDVQAPRSQDVQAPRSQDVQAPRSQDVQAPRSQDVQAPRSQDVQAPRSQDVQAPRSQDVQAPRTQNIQAPRSQDVQAPRSQDVQAPRSQ